MPVLLGELRRPVEGDPALLPAERAPVTGIPWEVIGAALWPSEAPSGTWDWPGQPSGPPGREGPLAEQLFLIG